MLGLYALGILAAILMARVFSRFLMKGEDLPFVMELPPYRMPTAKSVLIHTWEKAVSICKDGRYYFGVLSDYLGIELFPTFNRNGQCSANAEY